MDSLTQIVLGAACGEAVLGKKVGNKALLWGAVGGTIPDLDVIGKFFLNSIDGDYQHRGFSHSIVFAIIMAPILGWLVYKLYEKRKNEADWKAWSWLFFWSIFTHPILDCFTTWGTRLLWPLNERITFNSIFVVDPLYTLPFMGLLIWLMFKKRDSKIRRNINTVALTVSTSYLLLTVVNKEFIINPAFEKGFKSQGIEWVDYSTKPAPFNNILWYGTAETKNGYYIGYYSLFDADIPTQFDYYPKNHDLLEPYRGVELVDKAIFLAHGYYTAEQYNTDTVQLNDMRFGTAKISDNEKGKTVFSYWINKKEDGEIVIKKKPDDFTGMDKAMSMLWERIWGINND